MDYIAVGMAVVFNFAVGAVHKAEKVVQKYLELDNSDFALIEDQALREGQIIDYQTNSMECLKEFNYFEGDKGC